MRDQGDQLRTPPAHLPADFWETDELRAAFRTRHIGKVLKAYRNHPRHRKIYGKALNQGTLGRWLGVEQPQISKIENADEPEWDTMVVESYAATLKIPRHLLWIAPEGYTLSTYQNQLHDIDPVGNDALISVTGMNTVELIERMRLSSINSATIDALNITVEQLCCDYAHADARKLITTGKEWLHRSTELLNNRLTLPQHRDILHSAGMLALLVGCLEYDLGESAPAAATRGMALKLGEEAGVPGIVGWSHEMLAWFHLTSGNLRAVIPAADAGLASAPSHSVAVQLYGQQAKAFARMGEREKVHAALERGRALLDRLPYPERPDNHFVVDPEKWDFYAMDAYRIVGDNEQAEKNARQVIRRSANADGFVISPMRRTEAELTLAVIAARRGDVDEAATLGIEALNGHRQSRPSLLMVASELDQEIRNRINDDRSDFSELLRELKQSPEAGT